MIPEKSLREIDLHALTANRTYHPSPAHWEDEVIYFILLDRFSDGNESGFRDNTGRIVAAGRSPRFSATANANAVRTEAEARRWREAGNGFVGGTLAGAQSKLGYLRRLGITALWISPVFKQVPVENSYHGYGIQNFLDVDPHFGSRDDLRQLVTAAHDLGLRVILDIIINHAGDVFRYQNGDPPWNGQQFSVRGFRDPRGEPTLPLGPVDLQAHPDAFPDAAIWPAEFQDAGAFTREGHISDFDRFPEFADGDFFGLKDFHHGERRISDGQDQIDRYVVSPTLRHLCEVYKFWIAFADIDGYRLDTVKHMDPGAARFFASVIHEYAESIGKDNFYIIGEITGGRDFAFDRLEVTGLDAALGISDERVKMTRLVKGEGDPEEYFNLFTNSLLVHKDSHVWFKDKVVTSVDDHDHVDQGDQKHRFAAGGFANLVVPVVGLNAATIGIPCMYYGTEQLFDGEGGSDRFIREAMFGGEFGAFRSRGHHCFDEDQPTYRAIAEIHRLRQAQITLRRGRQFLRPISGNGQDFGLPRRLGSDRMRSIVAWSRIFGDQELLCAINTDPDRETRAFVTIDDEMHAAGGHLTCLYSTRPSEIGQTIAIEARNGKAVLLAVPPAGFVVYA
ncbi:MAG TPA: alpha-amylase family glycosyl hydrolase [Kofleriaceae bacterium]|nr:alpha-amylase family glycosyl hydrolase [Kofleriaceae bacterium]